MVVTANSQTELLQDHKQALILWLEDVGMSDVALVGGEMPL